MVPAASRRISRVLRYSGAVWLGPGCFAYAALTLFGPAFLRVPLHLPPRAVDGPPTPGPASPPPRFGLFRFRSPLLAESFLFSLPAGTEMFQFPAFAPASPVAGSLPPGSPIRISADLDVFAIPRGFSQLVTSFFASESHRHPPCALLRFPFLFRLPFLLRALFAGGGSPRLRSITLCPGLAFPPDSGGFYPPSSARPARPGFSTCVNSMSMSSFPFIFRSPRRI